MKTIAGKIATIILFVLFLSGLAAASDAADIRYKGRTHTVAWDAALLEDGTACADCRYEIYLKNKNTGIETKIGETPETAVNIAIPVQGKYWVGGLAKRTVDGEDTVSEKAWSDTPAACANGQTFFLDWVAAPGSLKGFRKTP